MEIKNKQKTRDSFLLIDSTVTLKNNDSLTEKYSKIITFDLESHRLLQKNVENKLKPLLSQNKK